jgi:cytochrome c oxidase subunit I
VGTNLTFLPQFLLGYDGMPRRIADYSPAEGWTTLNRLSTLGSYVVALSVLVFLVNVAVSWLAQRPAGPDPWEAQTLEWATTSPPPRHNFDTPLPPVRSAEPVLDMRESLAAVGRAGP